MTDEPDPWSKDVPVSPAPTEFVFAEPKNVAPPTVPPIDSPASGASPMDAPPVAIDLTTRRRWIAAGAGLSVVVAGLLVAAALGSDDSADSSTVSPETTVSPESTVVDVLPDTTAVPPRTLPGSSSSGSPETVEKDFVPPGTWTKGVFALPERFTRFEVPTQLVALSNRGLVIEIDLPSGTTATLNLDDRQSSSTLQLRDRVALITSESGSPGIAPLIVERGQPTITVDVPSESGGGYFVNTGSNIDEFVIRTYVITNPEVTTMVIGIDGSVRTVDESSESFFYGEFEVVTGERLLYDTGDLFLVSPPGQKPATARRISSGVLIGRSSSTLFVSECDAARVCDEVLIDVVTGARTAAPDNETVQFDRTNQNAVMSPDGAALLLISGESGDAKFFDLTTGDVTQLPLRIGGNYTTPDFSWVPDGSGIITLDGGDIVFVDRLTGQSTVLPIDLPNTDAIIDVRARPAPAP
jgi:hypothetical protein